MKVGTVAHTIDVTHVVLADARRQVRDTVSTLIAMEADLYVAATADDAVSTLLQAQRTRAHVVVVAAALGGSLADLCGDLHACDPRSRVLLLDDEQDPQTLLWAVESGVDAYVGGIEETSVLMEAIRLTGRGESFVPPAMLGQLLRHLIERRRAVTRAADRLNRLTPREREVFGLLVEGCDPGTVATALVIAPETARTHVQRVYRKLGVRTRAEVAELAERVGMADPLERVVERSIS